MERQVKIFKIYDEICDKIVKKTESIRHYNFTSFLKTTNLPMMAHGYPFVATAAFQ